MKTVFCGSDNEASIRALQIMLLKNVTVKYYLVSEEQDAETIEFCKNNSIQIIKDFPINEKFDLLVSFSFKRLLPIDLINNSGISINFHPAPLPYYRGRGTTSQVLLKGEDKWGVTCHYIAEKFDTGRIIERKWFDITDDLRIGKKLSDYSWHLCIDLLNDVLGRICNNIQLESFEQEKEGRYYSMKELTDAKRVSIDDNSSDINRKIEALWFPPFEGAYIEIDGERYYLINKKLLVEISENYR